ncbi:hypothetical protein [Anaerostipes caccae]|uniref:hypothetical protein n=1 Tax=Anaerostipes caccae TaxID=105841 RepID=UPI000587F6B6|nr:hypothetical protein [Anaerostipes caccae]
MYVKDNMHFTPKGATTLAKILSVEIKYKSQLNPISGKVSLRTNSLYKTINKASKLKSKKYNKKTWKYMQKKLKTSKKLLYSITPKQKSIDKSNASLKKAIKKLKKVKNTNNNHNRAIVDQNYHLISNCSFVFKSEFS